MGMIVNKCKKLGGGGTLSTPDEVFGDLSRVKFKHFGFTLAEMMVVMLILSIIMAAMAPVMTTRNKLDQSSPWSWSTNGSDAYYGLGDAQVAMIGQEEVKPDDDASKLIINAGNDKNHILFKTGNSALGQLRFKNNGLLLGSLSSGDISSNSLGIGHNILLSTNSTSVGINNSASGNNSSSYGYNTKATAERSTAIGYNNTASNNISTAVGAENTASGSGALAIGNGNNSNSSYSLTVGASNIVDKTESIAIGTYNEVNGEYSIAVGTGNVLNSNNSIGIGRMAAPSADAIAIGPQNTQAFGSHSIAIGNRASSMGEAAIAIGGVAENGIVTEALSYGAIAIGSSASAGVQNTVDNSLAIGVGTDSSEFSLALGGGSKAKNFAIAIGQSARAGMNYNSAYAIGIGYNADASSRSVALGVEANSAGTSSIAIGDLAVAAGDNNIAIGLNACRYVTGSNKVCIGANSGPTSGSSWATDSTERIFIGSKSKYNNGTAVLEVHNTTETAPNGMSSYRNMNASGVVINGALIVRGPIFTASRLNSSPVWNALTNTELRVLEHYEAKNSAGDSEAVLKRGYAWENLHPLVSSDRRLKYVGKENTSGLEKIKQLKVFNYTFKKDDKKTPHVGVIAQDLQKVFPDAVTKAKDGFLRIRFEDMFFAMINAIKELDSRITALEKENQKLKEQNKELDARLKVLEAKVK